MEGELLDPHPDCGGRRKPACGAGFRSDGASRTRTGDLLGAIQSVRSPRKRMVKPLPVYALTLPNIFPNTLRPVRR